jgi:hypothetical protein
VAELTDLLNLSAIGWPAGMRVIVRKERPLACEITSWMQLLALSGHHARRWEPKRLRLRLFSIAGQLTTTARRRTRHLSTHAPWTQLALHTLITLRALTGRRPQRITLGTPSRQPSTTPGSGIRHHPGDIGRPVTPTQHNHHRNRPIQPDQDPNGPRETSRLETTVWRIWRRVR